MYFGGVSGSVSGMSGSSGSSGSNSSNGSSIGNNRINILTHLGASSIGAGANASCADLRGGGSTSATLPTLAQTSALSNWNEASKKLAAAMEAANDAQKKAAAAVAAAAAKEAELEALQKAAATAAAANMKAAANASVQSALASAPTDFKSNPMALGMALDLGLARSNAMGSFSTHGSVMGPALGSFPAHGSALGSFPAHGFAAGSIPTHGSALGSIPTHGSALGSIPTHGSAAGSLPAHRSASGFLPLQHSSQQSSPLQKYALPMRWVSRTVSPDAWMDALNESMAHIHQVRVLEMGEGWDVDDGNSNRTHASFHRYLIVLKERIDFMLTFMSPPPSERDQLLAEMHYFNAQHEYYPSKTPKCRRGQYEMALRYNNALLADFKYTTFRLSRHQEIHVGSFRSAVLRAIRREAKVGFKNTPHLLPGDPHVTDAVVVALGSSTKPGVKLGFNLRVTGEVENTIKNLPFEYSNANIAVLRTHKHVFDEHLHAVLKMEKSTNPSNSSYGPLDIDHYKTTMDAHLKSMSRIAPANYYTRLHQAKFFCWIFDHEKRFEQRTRFQLVHDAIQLLDDALINVEFGHCLGPELHHEIPPCFRTVDIVRALAQAFNLLNP